MFTGITPRICAQAWDVTTPAIERGHAPHLFRAGDIKWPGGFVREGLVSAIRAISRVEVAAPVGLRDNGGPYLRK